MRETPNLITWLKLFDKDRGESGDPQPFLSYAAIRSDCLYLWYTEHFFFTFHSPGVHTLLHAIELCLLSPTICVLSCLPVPSLSFLFTLTLSWLHQKLNWFCRSFLPAKSVFFFLILAECFLIRGYLIVAVSSLTLHLKHLKAIIVVIWNYTNKTDLNCNSFNNNFVSYNLAYL